MVARGVGVVGGATTLTRALAATAALALTAQVAAASTTWETIGNCRDGRAQGPYQLRSDDGQLRIAGAFNEGTRTGSFIFWRDNGVREAHVPYDDRGVRNGTVATWYDGPSDREPPRHVESAWRRGLRDGTTRTWYPDGQRRSQTEYAQGRIVASIGWTESGEPLSDDAARELARADEQIADADYATRSNLIAEHMPSCGTRS